MKYVDNICGCQLQAANLVALHNPNREHTLESIIWA